MMSQMTNGLEIARAYHRAWNGGRYADAGSYLADELKVEVPINAYPTKASFLEAVERTSEMASKTELLAELGDADQALLLYDLTLPFGTMRVAEHFTVGGGRITKIRQIHDTAAIRAAFEAGLAPVNAIAGGSRAEKIG
jgi:ketosteroid isomerase-like protein